MKPKIITIALLLAFTVAALPASAADTAVTETEAPAIDATASETDTIATEPASAVSETDGAAISLTDDPSAVGTTATATEPTSPEIGGTATVSAAEPTAEAAETGGKVGGAMHALTDWIGVHLTELLCALTLAASAVTAWLYRRGLLPALGRAVSAIGMRVERAAQESGKALGSQGELLSGLREAVTPALERVERAASLVGAAGERLQSIEQTLRDQQSERRRLKIILETQAKLLCDIFNSANLPQYRKEQASEAYRKMLAFAEALDPSEAETVSDPVTRDTGDAQ